jgi:hypothetical protein
MTAMGEQLPRIFQANLAQLCKRIIQFAIDGLAPHPVLERGEASSMDEFLDRAAAQVDNYTTNEAAKSFVLTLAAVFGASAQRSVKIVRSSSIGGETTEKISLRISPQKQQRSILRE